MKVLLDISALGAGYRHDGSRTGVYRAIDCLASQLLCQRSCQLSLMAYGSLPLYASARNALANNPAFQNVHFLPPGGYTTRRIADLMAKISRENALLNFAMRGMHRIASRLPYNPALPSLDQISHYDVVHATYLGMPSTWRRLSHLCRFQTVYDLIPLIMPQFTTATHQRIARSCIDAIQPDDWVLAISEATKNDLCEYRGLDPRRVFVTPLAASEIFHQCVDTSMLHDIKDRYGIPDIPYILSLCTFEPRKNLPHLIDCFANLVEQEKINDLNLVLVGTTGWQHKAVFQQIRQYQHLKQRIIITGYVHDEDLAALYSGALMFVYPSLYEGFGLPPLEAMQCGVPVITSNTSSLPEVVGDAGIMVPPLDRHALCQAMLELYQHPGYAERYKERALARARLFSWRRSAEETVQAYRQAKECSVPRL